MKNMLLIVAGLTLSVTGCTAIDNAAVKRLSVVESVHILKTKGCNALPKLERRLLVILINSQIPDYPKNGICDPQWVQKELIKQIDKLESTTNTTPWLRANPLVDLSPENAELNYAA